MRPPDRHDVVLVTGSTGGLGREVARRLAGRAGHVIVHGRNPERGAAAVREMEEAGSGASFREADFASLERVREFAEWVLDAFGRLDVLVNNAGIWLPHSKERRLSADAHELHFAVNYLSGFLLTRLLLTRIRRSAPSRIVNVASGAQEAIDFGDVMLEEGYDGSRAYAQSKLAQVMFTFGLARELEGTGVEALVLHPATYMDTGMVREAGVRPRSTVDEGAEAVLRLVTEPAVESGRYYEGSRPARAHRQAYDPEARRRLRALSRELTGLK